MAIEETIDDSEKPSETINAEIQVEIGQARQELQEITLLLEQSQLEVNKLAQRNASVSSRLQQLHTQFDSIPRADIRMTYDTALDAQQRLFVMRGQLEKLQSDKAHIERYLTLLERVADTLDQGLLLESTGTRETFKSFEAIIQAQEAERQRLSRRMHDGQAQALSNFILQSEIAMRLFDVNQQQAREELKNLKESAGDTFQQVRDFIFELRPMMLDDLGLIPTLKRYIQAFQDQTESEIRFTVTGVERRLDNYIEVIIFRAVQDLLGNAIRDSQASQVEIRLDITEANIKVVLEDNGKGFDDEMLKDDNKIGVKVIKERVEMLGGYLNVDSVLGQGTRVIFQVPVGSSVRTSFA
jgi:two-component system sensor histidine kinase DegS